MVTENVKGFKKVSYFCLTLFSAVAPATAETNAHLRDYMERSGGQEFSLVRKNIDSLEKRPVLLYEGYNTHKDEVQKDLKSPRMGRHRECDSDNITLKYGKIKKSNLFSRSEEFSHNAEKMKRIEERNYDDLQKTQAKVINEIDYLAKKVVHDHVKDPEIKDFFLCVHKEIKGLFLEFLEVFER